MTTVFRVFLPFALGYFLSYLFRTVNAVIAPDLVRDVGLNPSDLGLLTSVYFLSFAAFQLPLGILLDRFGPRRVEAVLLLFAALGAFLFARADSLSGLIVGRALIGLGVSACLMAAFKAFTLWLPSERLPLANGIQMISGGAGALAATTPVEAALALTDWRGVFTIVAGLTLFAALFIFLLVPEQKRSASGETLGQQLAGVGAIYSSRTFWRVAPWALTAQAGYLSIYGLWSGPWLRDVAGFDRMAVANSLMLVSVSMMLGYFVSGALADRLSRRNVRPMTVAVWGMGAFMLVELALTLQSARFAVPLWLMFGFFGASCILPYAVLSQSFPKTLSWRVNTSLNV
ncbi:MAG: MFS transporter, partial [Desulfuromonadales bacterium]|nr:MFS transporter [Desulfuromonadales bacterium]